MRRLRDSRRLHRCWRRLSVDTTDQKELLSSGGSLGSFSGRVGFGGSRLRCAPAGIGLVGRILLQHHDEERQYADRTQTRPAVIV